MTNPIVGAINGGTIGLLVGAGLGLVHYTIFNGIYTDHQRKLYDNNGAVIILTGIGGGIGGCITGTIGGFHSAIVINDGGLMGGLTGGAVGGVAGGVGSILFDSWGANPPKPPSPS
jgi:hypothetical protein